MAILNIALVAHIPRQGIIHRFPAVEAGVSFMNETQETAYFLKIAGERRVVCDCVGEHSLSEVVHIIDRIFPGLGPSFVISDTLFAGPPQISNINVWYGTGVKLARCRRPFWSKLTQRVKLMKRPFGKRLNTA